VTISIDEYKPAVHDEKIERIIYLVRGQKVILWGRK
jgi:hypothetical protein